MRQEISLQPGEVGVQGEELLRAEALARRLGDVFLVRRASFVLRAGEILAITGPSGAGKSSLLRLLNRLDEPTSGRLLLEGVDASALDRRQLRRRLGMVMQQANLFPGTVAENLRYGPGLRGEAVEDERISELLATVGLSAEYARRGVEGLSGGEAQRVSVARTLANRPQVLLLDEPTSALDDEAKRTVEQALRSAMTRVQGACLLVTHDVAQARRLAHRTLAMRDGLLEESAGGSDA